MTVFAGAARVLMDAVARRVFPGASAEVGGPAGPWWRHAEGRLTYESDAPATTAETIYDLASLTKVLCTTTLAMRLVQAAGVTLETRVSDFFPRWRGTARERATIAHLLAHASGLPAWLPLYEQGSGRDFFERAICETPLAFEPGSGSVYSDLGFILLGFAIEDAARAGLREQFEAVTSKCPDIGDALAFSVAPGRLPWTAPTQLDEWRGRLLRGEADDRNAFALGGVAGHAGLFGSAPAVGAFARRMLRGLQGEREALGVGTETVRRFTSRAGVPGSSRALGWDTMLPSSSCGSRFSASAFGHTGFTGTSLWIDPEASLYAVLLTNRVHPSAGDPAAILAVRQAFHDAVADRR